MWIINLMIFQDLLPAEIQYVGDKSSSLAEYSLFRRRPYQSAWETDILQLGEDHQILVE